MEEDSRKVTRVRVGDAVDKGFVRIVCCETPGQCDSGTPCDQVLAAMFSLPAECTWVRWGEMSRGVEPWLWSGGNRDAGVLCFHEGVSDGPSSVILAFGWSTDRAPLNAICRFCWALEAVGDLLAAANEASVWSLRVHLLKARFVGDLACE